MNSEVREYLEIYTKVWYFPNKKTMPVDGIVKGFTRFLRLNKPELLTMMKSNYNQYTIDKFKIQLLQLDIPHRNIGCPSLGGHFEVKR